MDEHAGGRAGKREDLILDHLRLVCIQRDTLALELGLLKAELAIEAKAKRKIRSKA